MSASFLKNGIINTSEIEEPEGTSILLSNASYSYTPTTSSNSCLTGWLIDFTDRTAGEKFYVSVDVIFSGFEATASTGTFAIWFQGSCYKVSSSSFVWEGGSGVTGCWYNGNISLGNTITSVLTSQTSGLAHLTGSFNLNSNFPGTYSKQYFGLRSDYSNGTGKITLNNLRIIPEKYYLTGKNTKITNSNELVISNLFEY